MSAPKADLEISAAQARATAARARMERTVDHLKHRLSPQVLAQEATDTLKEKGLAAARDATAAAGRHPGMVAAVGGGLVLLLFRRSLLSLARRATARTPESLSPKPISKKGPSQ